MAWASSAFPEAGEASVPVALTAAQVGAKRTGGKDLVNQPVFSECFKLIGRNQFQADSSIAGRRALNCH